MRIILLAGFVVSILSFSCKTVTEKPVAPTGTTWEKHSAIPAENQDNIVSAGKGIAAMVFVVILTVLLLTLRRPDPVSFDWMYQV